MESLTASEVFQDLIRHPIRTVAMRWNWKSALLSGCFRGLLFFLINLSAGWAAARNAFVTEWLFRVIATGFYGAITQSFRQVQPRWKAIVIIILLMPSITQIVELLVHWIQGTPRLIMSIVASTLVTAFSASFSLFAMQRGVLIVGDNRKPLLDDLKMLPELGAAFCSSAYRFFRRRKGVLMVATLVIGALAILCHSAPRDPLGEPANWTTFNYEMTGKIRLLFFWIGRDNIGGGHIRILKPDVRIQDGEWMEAVEVLFGSMPERVPGRINRWGYGKEWSIWSETNIGDPQSRVLHRSFFQGFMRHSSEDNLSDVQSTEQAAKSGQEFWYDGILSSVFQDKTHSSVHKFHLKEEFDYRHPQWVEKGYEKRRVEGPPDYTRQLDNQKKEIYDVPYGFLTALRQMIFCLTTNFKTLSRSEWNQQRLNYEYAYNGRPYQLSLKDLRHHSKSKTSSRTIAKASQTSASDQNQSFLMADVAEANFRIHNIKKNKDYNFTIFFPLKGKFQGIPLKITHNPRWWLKLELDLN